MAVVPKIKIQGGDRKIILFVSELATKYKANHNNMKLYSDISKASS